MKRFLYFAIATVFASCSPKVYPPLEWQSKEIRADGNVSEWNIPLRFYDEKSKVNYTITNDSNNIYVCMKVVDRSMQMKMVRSGVTVKIDTLLGSKYPISLTYPEKEAFGHHGPMENADDDLSTGGVRIGSTEDIAVMQSTKGEGRSMRFDALKVGRNASVSGLKNVPDGLIDVQDNQWGIKAGMNRDKSGTLFCEFVIPFSSFLSGKAISSKETRMLAFEIEIKGIDRPSEKGGSPHGAPMGGPSGRGGMGGGPQGNMGGGPQGGFGGHQPGGQHPDGMPDADRSSMKSANKINLKATLSVQ